MSTPDPFQPKPLSLAKAVSYLLEECRIVLPGIQVLFGFQLIVVFSERFATVLTAHEQRLHLVATALVVLATALIMAPAAYHRQIGPQQISQSLVRVSTWLLLASMPPLAVAISLDFYLVARVVMGDGSVVWMAALLLGVFIGLWLVLPQIARWRQRHRG
jgi:hypothetical protein